MGRVDNAVLLERLGSGDAEVWSLLVKRHAQSVWSATAGFRLDDATRHDVCQTVWLKLYDKAASVREPDRLVGWLTRVAHNECISVLRRRRRLVSLDDGLDDHIDAGDEALGERIDLDEDRVAVRLAFAALDERCRELLLLLLEEPPPSYDELSEVLGVPRGSLGPTRRRCLEKLAKRPELAQHLATRRDGHG